MLPHVSARRGKSSSYSVSRKHVAYALFLVANVFWFFWTLMYVSGPNTTVSSQHENKNPYESELTDEFPFGEPLSVRDARAKGILSPRQASPKGGLFGKSAGKSDSTVGNFPSVLQGAALARASTVKDLTVTDSLNAGSLKVSGNVLSSTTGMLLISSNGIGIGTSSISASDKLVVNGPIRISDGGTRPECDNNHRGMLWHEFAEMGDADDVNMCVKTKADEYHWRSVLTSGGGFSRDGAGSKVRAGRNAIAAGGGDSEGLTRNFLVGPGEGIGLGDVVSFVGGKVQRGFGVHYSKRKVFAEPTGARGLTGGANGGANGHKRRLQVLPLLSEGGVVVLRGGEPGVRGGAQLGSLPQREGATKLPRDEDEQEQEQKFFVEHDNAEFGPAGLDHFAAAALSDKLFVIAYADPSEQNAGRVVVGRVSSEGGIANDGTLSFDLPVPLLAEPDEEANANGNGKHKVRFSKVKERTKGVAFKAAGPAIAGVAVCALGPGRFVVAFNTKNANGGHGSPMIVYGRISSEEEEEEEEEQDSDAKEKGKPSVRLSNATLLDEHIDGFSLVPLGVDHAALIYRNLRTKAAGVRLARVQQDTGLMTLGEEAIVPTKDRLLTYLHASPMASHRIAVAYADGAEGHVVMLDSSGEKVTVGPASRFSVNKPLSVSIATLASDRIVVAFYTSNPWRAIVMKGEVGTGGGMMSNEGGNGDGNGNGELVTFTEHVLSEHYSTHTSVGAVGSDAFVVVYYDGSNADAGTMVMGRLGSGMGVAADSGTEGEQIPVLFNGVSRGHRNLVVGACYYSLADGKLTTKRTARKVGLAISQTEFLVGSQGC